MTRMTLDKLKKGCSAKVVCFAKEERAYRQKLLAMGITPGTYIKLVRVAPLGDPIEIKVLGTHISLRKPEAKAITVEYTGHDN